MPETSPEIVAPRPPKTRAELVDLIEQAVLTQNTTVDPGFACAEISQSVLSETYELFRHRAAERIEAMARHSRAVDQEIVAHERARRAAQVAAWLVICKLGLQDAPELQSFAYYAGVERARQAVSRANGIVEEAGRRGIDLGASQ